MIEEALTESFELRGEDVIRLSSGKVVWPKPKGYTLVSVKVAGVWRPIRYHRIKFYLAHGFLPPYVDHEDRDRSNSSLGNLRPATNSQNLANQPPRGKYPKGVRRHKSGRFGAYVASCGIQRGLEHMTP
jgi:hypothetical protein